MRPFPLYSHIQRHLALEWQGVPVGWIQLSALEWWARTDSNRGPPACEAECPSYVIDLIGRLSRPGGLLPTTGR